MRPQERSRAEGGGAGLLIAGWKVLLLASLTSELGCDVQVVDVVARHGEAPSTHPQRQQHDGQRVVAARVARGNHQTGRKYGPCCRGNEPTFS